MNVSALDIRTAPDLVFVPPADPELLWELPTGSITFPDLTNHIAHVRNAFAGPALAGDQLSGGLKARVQLPSVHSGLPALDELVGNRFGGASGHRIIEISGANAVRKTVPLVIREDDNLCDGRRYLRCTSPYITLSRTRPTRRCCSIPPAISHHCASPRSLRYEPAYVFCIAGGKSTLVVSSGKDQVRSGSAFPRGKPRGKRERKGRRESVCVYDTRRLRMSHLNGAE